MDKESFFPKNDFIIKKRDFFHNIVIVTANYDIQIKDKKLIWLSKNSIIIPDKPPCVMVLFAGGGVSDFTSNHIAELPCVVGDL